MWTELTVLLSALTFLSVSQNTTRFQDEIDGFVPSTGQKFDTFDWQLCNALAKKYPGNMVVSPISIKLLLKMLYEGSTGQSADELARALKLPRDKTISRMESSVTLRSLQAPSQYYDMEIGSKIFISEDVTPKNWYQRILYLYYNAYIEKVDFVNTRAATNRINNWVKYVTHQQIKDFLTTADGLESTVMLLINAIYFKGTWSTPFGKGDTIPGKFHSPDGLKDVGYMTQSNYFYYSRLERVQAQILRLPYLGQKFSMYIVLPDKRDGLDELIQNINPLELRKKIWLLEETSLEVFLPKFRFEHKTELKDLLQQLGIRKVFDSYGDMKGLTKNGKIKDLVVSNVIQKASIDVNEEGSVAAAATEFQLINKFGGSDEVFNASHPFLFFIEDESTGTIVFVGKVVNPEGYVPPQPQPVKTTPPSTFTQRRVVPSFPIPGNIVRGNHTGRLI